MKTHSFHTSLHFDNTLQWDIAAAKSCILADKSNYQ